MKNRYHPAVIILLWILVGCSSSNPRNPRFINTPSNYNPSFFQKHGDAKIAVDGVFGVSEFLNGKFISEENGVKTTLLPRDFSSGFGIEGGYALTDHFMINAGVNHFNEASYYLDNDLSLGKEKSSVNYRRTFYDVGLGYYTALNQNNTTYLNLIGGYRFGPMTSTIYGNGKEYYFNGRSNKTYLSPAFNYFFTPVYRMSFSPTISLLKYNNINTNYDESRLNDLQLKRVYNEAFVFLEPSMAFQFGLRGSDWLKFDLGLNYASNTNIKIEKSIFDDTENIRSRRLIMSVGISIYPNKKTGIKKKPTDHASMGLLTLGQCF